MLRLRYHVRFLVVSLISLIASQDHAAGPPSPSDTCDKFVSQYMAGQWDDLELALKANAKLHLTFTASQKADIDYITQTLRECHPAWWNLAKSGKRTRIGVLIFGQPVNAAYDPQQKEGMNARFDGDSMQFTLGWPATDMDSTQQAEHGFTKGELGNGAVWDTLGMAAGYSKLSADSLINPTDAEKLKLTRTLDFEGNLAAAYYGSPRTRQWWFFLGMHYYRKQYQKSPVVMSHEVLGAMFVAEVAAHPDQYPSIKLPEKLNAEDAEEKLVAAVHDRIEKHGWTLAEDKLIRDAVKALATTNAAVMHTGGPVRLANGLQVSLEPGDDATLRAKRDQWLARKLAGN